ncbi:diguanylate cyclase [Ruegeria sediminis]|uniref:Diguanylate cyclase n=1 Tax=Ruegeria sediminis TaxID=2583820 RepID=A0ABY2WXN3_9RHOB|nr:PAS-domain containing protein [Ruegeria sediminis]TMV07222.1 diguanylate cyclase [Ruegeria sediminis]
MADWIILGLISLATSSFAVLWLAPRRRRNDPTYGMLSTASIFDAVFLFDGTKLLAHSDIALAGYENVTDWDGLRLLLRRDFPEFPATPDVICSEGSVTVPAIDRAINREVLCEWIDGVVRVQLRDLSEQPRSGQSRDAAGDPMRLAMDKAPYPVWLHDAEGKVRWCNAAYVTLARRIRGPGADLTAPVFPRNEDDGLPGKKTRVSITADDSGQKMWFDLSLVPRDAETLCYAVDVNAIVEAEIAQRKFVQTLAKTFAQLSIGLAIFDRNRQLALFNPALVDLTTLPADFLSCRPGISSFFDRLRNHNMMPEPKNYRGWRSQMNALLEGAQDGSYQETWSLPSGSVYSVSGRPHPDGAVAFLFEDITAEITLTRRFRSELELVQAILDKLADAIAVFSADGTLAFSNFAYHRLWGTSDESGFVQVSVIDATRMWQDRCAATPIWGEIRDFVDMRENRAEWSAPIRTRTGLQLICTVSPIQNGATIVRFATGAAETEIHELEQAGV